MKTPPRLSPAPHKALTSGTNKTPPLPKPVTPTLLPASKLALSQWLPAGSMLYKGRHCPLILSNLEFAGQLAALTGRFPDPSIVAGNRPYFALLAG